MKAMTMPYNVKNEEDLTKVSAGDQIAADVVVSAEEGRYLENVKVTSHATEKPTEKPAENRRQAVTRRSNLYIERLRSWGEPRRWTIASRNAFAGT